MLKQRIITAVILAAIVLSALFGLGREGFALLAAVFFLAAGWEWSGMTASLATPLRVLWVASLAGLLFAVEWFRPAWIVWLALWWLPALALVVAYPKGANLWYHPWRMAVLGWLLLVPSFEAVITIKANGALGLVGPYALLLILVWVWAADIGAFFAGRAFGRHKLAPSVSPGKTLEGLAGGVGLSLLVMALVLWLAPVAGTFWKVLVLVLVTVLASVLGDLFESMVKRQRGVKDSGTLLPGHGGMLDRIDSMTSALPVAVALLYWLQLPAGLAG